MISKRNQEIIKLYTEGLSHKWIAKQYGLSNGYVRRIIYKAGAWC